MKKLIEIKSFILINILGGATRAFYSFSKGSSKRKITIQFIFGCLAIVPAYLIILTFNLNPTVSLLVGYVFGILGEKIIEYVLQKHSELFDVFVNRLDEMN